MKAIPTKAPWQAKALAAIAMVACAVAPQAGAAAVNTLERGAVLSSQAAQCLGPADFVTQYAPPAPGRMRMRVQNIGDPGTQEQAQEVANQVSWDVGLVTGLRAAPASQRGYRDDGLPVGSSAFQLACDGAGFFINTFQFDHKVPLSGDGPNAYLGQDFDPPLPFGDGIVISLDAKVPWLLSQSPPPNQGVAQLNILYYLRDAKSGGTVAHVIGLYDSRPFGQDGLGHEFTSSDGVTSFASSPLLPSDSAGNPIAFVSPPTAGQSQFATNWSDSRHFQAVVTVAELGRIIAALRLREPALSTDPADYGVILYAAGVEVMPGTDDTHNVSFGASVTNLRLESFRFARLRGASGSFR